MFRSAALTLILCLATITAQASLLGRSPLTPGGTDYQAYYDTVLDITWLADANAVAGTPFDDVLLFGSVTFSTPTDGKTTWNSAEAWIASLNTDTFLGVSDWRQPSMDRNGDTVVVECTGTNEVACRDNEMSYQEQYNGVEQTVCGFQLCIGGPFTNVGRDYYWSGTTYAPNPNAVWVFYFPTGGELYHIDKSTTLYVWPVRPGDIALDAVPIPPAVWLFGSALGAMGVVRRKLNA
jgi:hypothetical protein